MLLRAAFIIPLTAVLFIGCVSCRSRFSTFFLRTSSVSFVFNFSIFSLVWAKI
ncbi:hypothetical protein F5Y08DRAFT_317841 [Xylaria arbuscula]|nr:hypothetical protein F5Y08DRAFT_317841 [Xylaria arbuscula]